MIRQTKFTYSSLGKAFEKQSNAMKDQGEYRFKYEYEDDEYDKDQFIKMLILIIILILDMVLF